MLGQPTVDLSMFVPASFSGEAFAEFDHFANPDQERCFACNSRAMLVAPIEVTDDYVLLAATTRLDNGDFVVIPGVWLVYPREHLVSSAEMPDNWTGCVKRAVATLGIEEPFCTSENWGRAAGQTVSHGHTWIITRGVAEHGLVTENTGLATIILRAQQHGILMPS